MKPHFPIFQNHPNLSYLDNASSTQKPTAVLESMEKFYRNHYANVHRGIYTLSEESTEMYEKARQTVAKFIGAKNSKEIIFTSGTTDSINFVASSWNLNNPNGQILTTEIEHHANIVPWQIRSHRIEKQDLLFVKVGNDLQIDLQDLEEKLDRNQPKLLTLTHASNTLGSISPVEKIVEIKNRVSPNTRILVDGAQAVAHFPVNVEKLGVDFYVFSGHKVYGPTGIGVLWARDEVLEHELEPFRYGGGMISEVNYQSSTWAEVREKFEGGTPNIAGAIGLASAIDFVSEIGFDQIEGIEKELMTYFESEIKEIPEVSILGPITQRQGVYSLHIDKIHPHDVAQILNNHNVAVRAGNHCTQILMRQVLNVPSTTRVSFGMYNTKEDVDKLVEGLKEVLKIFLIY